MRDAIVNIRRKKKHHGPDGYVYDHHHPRPSFWRLSALSFITTTSPESASAQGGTPTMTMADVDGLGGVCS